MSKQSLEDQRAVYESLKNWHKLIHKPPEKDIWTILPIMPKVKFLNLKVLDVSPVMSDNPNEVSINFIYDDIQKIQP